MHTCMKGVVWNMVRRGVVHGGTLQGNKMLVITEYTKWYLGRIFGIVRFSITTDKPARLTRL